MSDDVEYPSNSVSKKTKRTRAKTNIPVRPDEDEVKETPTPKVERPEPPVVRTRVRKETFLSKVQKTFFGGSPDGVARYIFMDVLIPAAKDTIQDIVTKGIEMWLFGESSGRRRSNSSNSRGTVISYGNYYRNAREKPDTRYSRYSKEDRQPSFRSRISAVVFDYEEDAAEVLEFMIEILDKYESVSVADFYEAAGLSRHSEFTDNDWGWTSLSRTRIVRTRDGFEIEFPEPRRLE